MKNIFKFLALLLFVGCHHPVEIEEVVHDTLFVSNIDSFIQIVKEKEVIFEKDSISHIEYMRGDTVFIKETIFKQRAKDYNLDKATDHTKKDSIRVVTKTKYVTKVVENKLSWWQKMQIYLGRLFMIGLLLFIIYSGVKKKAWIIRFVSLLRKIL